MRIRVGIDRLIAARETDIAFMREGLTMRSSPVSRGKNRAGERSQRLTGLFFHTLEPGRVTYPDPD